MKPLLINNLEFAQKNLTLNGDLPAESCPRLQELLGAPRQNTAHIHYTLTGAAKKLHLPSLHLMIQAQLPVHCQRCLAPMQIALNLAFDYVICQNAPDEDDNDEVDWLEPAQRMDLCELIEDELLAAMPIASTHDFDCAKVSMQSGEKPNPFAVLKGKF